MGYFLSFRVIVVLQQHNHSPILWVWGGGGGGGGSRTQTQMYVTRTLYYTAAYVRLGLGREQLGTKIIIGLYNIKHLSGVITPSVRVIITVSTSVPSTQTTKKKWFTRCYRGWRDGVNKFICTNVTRFNRTNPCNN